MASSIPTRSNAYNQALAELNKIAKADAQALVDFLLEQGYSTTQITQIINDRTNYPLSRQAFIKKYSRKGGE